MSKAIFEKEAAGTNFCVNYVWLCPREPAHPDYATRLPLHYFERVYSNASAYPEAKVNIWIDPKQLTISDRFFLDSHRYIFEAGRINIQSLRDITEYRDYPGFDPDSDIALYAKADFARILVLSHLTKTEPDTAVVYADLDCEDIKLNDERVNDTLDEFGFVFGKAAGNNACNGYIALKGEKGHDILENYFLPRTTRAFQKNLINHYGAFSKAINSYRNKNHPEITRGRWGIVELPLMRTTMPYNHNVYDGVCPSRQPRVPGSKDLV